MPLLFLPAVLMGKLPPIKKLSQLMLWLLNEKPDDFVLQCRAFAEEVMLFVGTEDQSVPQERES